MIMSDAKIRLMTERKYEMIPINSIKVLNSRNRDKTQFEENIRSIKTVGLLNPIVVNERNFERTGCYELVCGEGRYLAYKALEYPDIPSEVINCNRKQALLYSLVENIARVTPGTMWFAREIKRMCDAGWTYGQVANIVGKTETYVRDYVRLVEQGEERLIRGVEQGLFPIAFALQVARSDSSTIQNVLMDAFDKGMVTSHNLYVVRNLMERRIKHGKEMDTGEKAGKGVSRVSDYSVTQLKKDIVKVSKEKESFVHETTRKENRLLMLIDGINALWRDNELAALLKAEGLDQRPQLEGNYNV